MASIPKMLLSEEEYLIQERSAEYKSEYYNGEVFVIAGALKEHNKIVASIIAELGQYLKKKPCSFFPRDIRVFNKENGLYTYPDVTIVCGEEKYLDEKFDTLLNPTVLFEVLSPSTENYDRGMKFNLYRSIPSLENYVLISSTVYAAEVYSRDSDKWILTTAKGRVSSLRISAIDFELPLEDVYGQINSL